MPKKKKVKSRHALKWLARMERGTPSAKAYARLKNNFSHWVDHSYTVGEVMEALDDDVVMLSLLLEKRRTTGKDLVDDLSSEEMEDVWIRFQAWKAASAGSEAMIKWRLQEQKC